MKPHLIMPMGGEGSRFFKYGYMQPKPLIEINERPFFYWATASIIKYIDIEDLTFVILKKHVNENGIDDVIMNYYPDAKIIIIPEVLPGPVFTSLKGIQGINDDAPVIFNDCDHMFRCTELINAFAENDFNADAALLTFKSDEPQFSYVEYKEGIITGTVEKKVVSNHAICGAYVFKNASLFKRITSIYIDNCPYSECYMSGLYNVMCEKGMVIKDYMLDYHVEYGTPDEYNKAKESKYFNDLI